ncbi:hypothetical protein EVAR_98452_1 [Eumeta japonica]|uniref:Uncharacterized protein n=1 Tax=Eumeta variegata TaxID=151549 RepID=A0A4C1YT18_EUMVA|nr:hypothetical protein EVAR_98452_1 [Eumeta japonica]
MVFERSESTNERDILIEGEIVEQVKVFVFLGSLLTNDGKHDRDIERRGNAGDRVNGALLSIMNSKSISRLAIHNEVLIPTLMCVSENWVWQKKNKSRVDVMERLSLRSQCGVSREDRCRDSNVRERCSLQEDVVIRVERDMLRWFGHL